ncbi:hypothetical protein SAMN04244576_06396 [Sinorhizobium meliloti]|nr:hypothetical protein SAMN04244576_06396 [Sinorhizobium meliloti]
MNGASGSSTRHGSRTNSSERCLSSQAGSCGFRFRSPSLVFTSRRSWGISRDTIPASRSNSTDPRPVDLVAEPFDVAIRIGKLEDSSLITRLIGRHSRHLYASPGYIEASGEHAQQRRRPGGQPPRASHCSPRRSPPKTWPMAAPTRYARKAGRRSASTLSLNLIPAMTQRCINFLSSRLMKA